MSAAPGVYLLHGGGMVGGSRWALAPMLVEWVLEYDAVAAAVEYRLAPEFPDPVPVEDCYAGLSGSSAGPRSFGFDPRRVLIGGQSAGGGLAAGTTLLARDRGSRCRLRRLLMWPMLDDRNETVSAEQIDGVGIWDRTSNETGWTALLGDRRGTADVSIYAAPARATDLTGLPPTYIEAGSAEVFRDEAVAFASGIWAAGGNAELHVWAGGFHGFQSIVPTAAVSRAAVHDARGVGAPRAGSLTRFGERHRRARHPITRPRLPPSCAQPVVDGVNSVTLRSGTRSGPAPERSTTHLRTPARIEWAILARVPSRDPQTSPTRWIIDEVAGGSNRQRQAASRRARRRTSIASSASR